MKSGKDIDRIYRDRFRGAAMPPPPEAWENILSHLPQKEQNKRLFPLWIRIAGVAAVLALLTTIFTNISGPASSEKIVFSPAPSKADFQIPEISATFNEIMKESDVLLQALILHSSEMNFQEKKAGLAASPVRVVEDSPIKSKETEIPAKADAAQIAGSEIILAEEPLEEQMSSSREVVETSLGLQQKESGNAISEKGKSGKKFKLSTRIAPVYFNSFGGGNAVESAFSSKEASGEVSFSYGVNVAYEVSEKWNLRAGIHKVGLAYNTREISFNEVAATTAYSINLDNSYTLALPSGGTLNQEMGFFEVPLEVEYVILDKKLGVGLIGGGSLLLLEENQVSLSSMGNNTEIGGANNMNKLSFTTNFGLSLGYDVTKQLEIGVEPVVKFPLNTFKNSGGSGPYFFGIYSGFSYKF